MKVEVKTLRRIEPSRESRNFDHVKYLVTRKARGKTINDFIYEHDKSWLNLYERTRFSSQDECIRALPAIR